jgi:geranylgeranyl diphosphate synthase type I
VPQAINTGDTMFSLSRIALHRLTDLGFPDSTVLRLMRLYDETCLALCEGQYIDIAMSASDELIGVDRYFDMIGRKTAALIAASIEAGALLATTDEQVIARYRAFGWALGLAFQLNDDLLGIWGPERTTGKEPSDMLHHKKTLPVIYAAEHAGPEDRERLAELRAATDPTTAEVAEIIEILERTGAREYTRDQARHYRDQALAELDAAGVVKPEARARLEQIIVSVIDA